MAWAVTQLRDNACTDTPELDAQLLAAHILRVSRTHLFAFPETVLEPASHSAMNSALQRRTAGEPIAYITGVSEFWSRALIVSASTLDPRADTEVLVEKAIDMDSTGTAQALPAGIVLDLGTGTGAVAIAVASELPERQVVAIERSAQALLVARQNVIRHDCSNVNLLCSSWLDAIADNSVAMVLANPPYLADNDPHLAQLKHEPLEALVSGQTGLEDLEHIICNTVRAGKPGAALLLEHGCDQGGAVRQLLTRYGYQGVATYLDLAGRERVSLGYVKKNA